MKLRDVKSTGLPKAPLAGGQQPTTEQRVEPRVEQRVERGAEPERTEGPRPSVATERSLHKALRSIAVFGDTKSSAGTHKGAKLASLGARLMKKAKQAQKVAVAAAIASCALFSLPQHAHADVIYAGKNPVIQQVGTTIASRTQQPFVQVEASRAALEQVLAKAQAGELKLTHLILDDEAGALKDSWTWSQLQERYPKAFAQVELVHVLGHDLAQNAFAGWQGSVFPNVKGIVSLDPRTALNDDSVTAHVIDQTAAAVAGLAGGLSPQDALIQAKLVAEKGAKDNVRTRVDVGQQSHTSTVDNAMTQWLAVQQQAGSLTKAALVEQVTALASTGALDDAALGALFWQLNEPGFRADYDAARFGLHLVDIRRAGGSELMLKAVADGNVHQVRHQLASELSTAPYAQERSPIFSDNFTRGLSLQGGALETGGIQGHAYLVDGLGVIKNGEVTAQAIRHPKHGDGVQLTFKLGKGAGERLEAWLAQQSGAKLIDKTIVNAAPVDGRVVTVERDDNVQATATIDQGQPEMSIGPALRLERPGAFRLDYFPEALAKQSMRGEVHLQAYGKTPAEQQANLKKILEQLGLHDHVKRGPSADAEAKLIALRLLEQADPRAHHQMLAKIEKGDPVTIAQLHDALVAAEVPPAFLKQAYFAEASPGHLSVIVPGQSEAYQRRGVRGVYHTVGASETIAFILADGALMSTKDRLQVGKVFRGMSSDTDLRTGGADFLFTRQITEAMGNPEMSGMRGGAILFKMDVLDRADWFAYAGDQFGTTLAGDRGALTPHTRRIAKQTFDALQQQGDSWVQGQAFEVWLAQLADAQKDSREEIYLPRPVGRHQVKQTTSGSNETMFEGTGPVAQIDRIVIPTQEGYDKLMAKLKELGVTHVQGRPVEEVVKLRTGKVFTDEEWKQLNDTPAPVQPGDKIGTDGAPIKTPPRLEFYVHVPGLAQAGGHRA